MLKKIGRIAVRIVLGIFVFYLFCAWVVIPFGLTWAIKSQGTKILKHPVRARAVQFNPFLWRLSIYGFEITDGQKEKAVTFDRLSVDVSFLSLIKKIYHVESIRLDGLAVHGALLPDGHINLIDLIPPPAPAGAPASSEKTVTPPPSTTAEKPAALPLVLVDNITLSKGRIQFDDRSVTPQFTTVLSDINIVISGFSTRPEDKTTVTFSAKLDDKGTMQAQALLRPLAQPLEMEADFSIDSYALTITSPYVGKYTGRGLSDGKLDFKTTYNISDNSLVASHKLLIQRFEFGNKVESKDALSLPFGLAIALLEDPQGRINISLPVKGDMSDPEFKYTHLIVQVVRNFFVKLMTKPFAILGSVLGSDSGTDELGYVKFTPGQSTISDEEKAKLAVLVKGLQDRPRLLLQVNGSYDPGADWKAIKTDVFERDYKTLKGESTKEDSWVFQQLYQRRFGVRDLWHLTKSFKQKDGTHDYEKLNAEIKRQLIEDSSADKVAMEFLAQERAKIVYDSIIAAGLDPQRVSMGSPHEVQSSMGFVPLEFTLTIFGPTETTEPEQPPVEAGVTNDKD